MAYQPKYLVAGLSLYSAWWKPGGARPRTYSILLTTMLLGGLWDGANWTFVTWGAIHGTGLAVERFLNVAREPTHGRLFSMW